MLPLDAVSRHVHQPRNTDDVLVIRTIGGSGDPGLVTGQVPGVRVIWGQPGAPSWTISRIVSASWSSSRTLLSRSVRPVSCSMRPSR